MKFAKISVIPRASDKPNDERALGTRMMAVKLFFFLFGISLVFFTQAVHLKDAIPDEKWDYVNVRENAHMFWWLYGADDRMHRTNLPLVLWLQGGPGGSSTGFGNFDELGPLDVNLKPRNTSWTQIANVLFVDNPVGAGFSYVTNKDAYTKDVKGWLNIYDFFVCFGVK